MDFVDQIIQGDALTVLPAVPDATFDLALTDPPYGLEFMGQGWDHGVPGIDYWAEALRVAKPGSYLFAFGAPRTYHRLTCAIEDAGWEIRDCILWVYGMGFPKSKNIGKATGQAKWDGWGTGLKPAWEPILVAMKPLDGGVAHNALTWGVGGLDIDRCRVPVGDNEPDSGAMFYRNRGRPMPRNRQNYFGGKDRTVICVPIDGGRWPANLIHDGSPDVTSLFPARLFYCAKASRAERGEGNKHPTVKPLALVEYLVRLGSREGHLILDPFVGSGTTAIAAKRLGRHYTGIDTDAGYCEIAKARLSERAESLFQGAT